MSEPKTEFHSICKTTIASLLVSEDDTHVTVVDHGDGAMSMLVIEYDRQLNEDNSLNVEASKPPVVVRFEHGETPYRDSLLLALASYFEPITAIEIADRITEMLHQHDQ